MRATEVEATSDTVPLSAWTAPVEPMSASDVALTVKVLSASSADASLSTIVTCDVAVAARDPPRVSVPLRWISASGAVGDLSSAVSVTSPAVTASPAAKVIFSAVIESVAVPSVRAPTVMAS